MFGRDNSDDQDQASTDNGLGVTDAVSNDDGPQEELTLPSVPADSGYMTAVPLPGGTNTTPDLSNEPETVTSEAHTSETTTEPAEAPPIEIAETPTPEPEEEPVEEITAPVPDAELSHTDHSSTTISDLGALKQQALKELSPLLHKLDQTPEDKYKVALMVYEETKDQNMLNTVYEAAKNLPDETAKAEAIYDIVKKINEIS